MGRNRGIEIRTDILELLVVTPLDLTDLAASKILPEISVATTSGDINILPAGVGYKLGDNSRAEDGGYDRTTYDLAEDSYKTKLYGAEETVDNISAIELDMLYSQEEVAAQIVRNRILLGREKRVADTVFNTTTFTGAGYTSTVVTKWNLPAADFRKDIWDAHIPIRARLKVGLDQLSLIVTSDRVRDMLSTLSAVDSIKYNVSMLLQDKGTQLQALSTYIGVKEIVMVNPMADKAGLGLTANYDYLYPNDMAMLALLSPAVESWKMGGLGRQPVFTKLTNDIMYESYDVEEKDKRVLRAKEYRGEFLTKGNGFLIKGIA